MSEASCCRSRQVAVPDLLMRARVWRELMPTGLPGDWVKPLGKPARSMSQAAGSLMRSGPAGQVGDFRFGDAENLGDVGQLARRDDGVFEEAAGGTGVGGGVGGVDQHSLVGANFADGGVDFERRGLGGGGEVFAQVGVGEVGFGGGVEPEDDLGDDCSGCGACS